MSIVWTILMLMVMIFVHEFGHFITAKSFGVQVNEFAIGMGPKLFGWGKGETKYSFRLFPIGGYCQIEGEDGDSDNERAFSRQKPIKRLIILAAGALMNILLALVVSLVINILAPAYISNEVGELLPDGALAQTAVQEGDKLVKINQTTIHYFDDINLYMTFTDGSPLKMTFKRGNRYFTEMVTPKLSEDGRYMIGFYTVSKPQTITSTISNACFDTIYNVRCVFMSLSWLVTGRAKLSDMSGPVGIVTAVDVVTEQAENGFFVLLSILNLASLISVNLGVFNLLPLPALDGGRIVFVLIEGVTKKKVNPKFEATYHAVGLMLLMILAVYVTYSDITKLR